MILISSQSSYSQFQFSYYNLKDRLQKGVQLFDYRTYYLGFGEQGGQPTVERTRQAARYTGGTVSAVYPFSRFFRAEGNLGYISRNVNYPFLIPGPGGISICCGVIPNLKNNYPIATLSFVADTTQYQIWGPQAGYRLLLGASYAPDFQKDVSVPPGATVGATLSQDLTWDAREYLPITKRMLLAFRFAGLTSKGNVPTICQFGGLDTFRGINYGGVFGNTCAYANFELRFPLIDLLALPFIAFSDIRGHIFFDIGGSKLKGGSFQFWNSETNEFEDAIASYGGGIDVQLLGLPFHFDWARLMDTRLARTLQLNTTTYQFSWYIGYTF